MNSLVATAGKDFYFTFCHYKYYENRLMPKIKGWKHLLQKLHIGWGEVPGIQSYQHQSHTKNLRRYKNFWLMYWQITYCVPVTFANWDPWTFFWRTSKPFKRSFLNHEEDTGRKLVHECVYDTCKLYLEGKERLEKTQISMACSGSCI